MKPTPKRKSRQSKPADQRASGPGTAGRNVARDKKICDRYAVVGSYTKVGPEFGLSRERVRQIIWKAARSAAKFKRLKPLRDAFAKGV